jgi:alpha-beta hydrolase superfamily lysophospholipase
VSADLMSENKNKFRCSDGFELHLHAWKIANPKATVLVVHGMTEHGGRYREFAKKLNSEGFSVIAYDQRGHGLSVQHGFPRGAWPANNFWDITKRDLKELFTEIQSTSLQPVLLFGHSMGSMISMATLQSREINPKVAVLCGYPSKRAFLVSLGKWLCSVLVSKRNQYLPFPFQKVGIYLFANRYFKGSTTSFDWLSSDPMQVKSYVNDPLCQMTCSWGFYSNLLNLLESIHKPGNIRKIDHHQSLLFMFGGNDPISGFENGILQTLDAIRKYHRHPEWRIFPDARHEMFADYSSDIFYDELLSSFHQVLEK